MKEYEKYLNSVIRLLTLRPRTEKEITDYLKKKKTPDDIIEKIISKCRDYGFINDKKFAQEWIRSRMNYKLKSKRVVKMELHQKGISKDEVEDVLSNTDQEINDLEQAKKLASQRITRYKNLPKNEIHRKLGGFLGRRGFDWDTIKRTIDDVL